MGKIPESICSVARSLGVLGERWTFLILREAFLGATLGIMSVMLIGIHGGPTFFPGTSLFHLLGYVGLFFSTVLVLRVVIAICREGI